MEYNGPRGLSLRKTGKLFQIHSRPLAQPQNLLESNQDLRDSKLK